MASSHTDEAGPPHPPQDPTSGGEEVMALDRSAFHRSFQVAALRLPAKLCNTAVKQLQPYLLRVRGIKPILKPPPPEDGTAAAAAGDEERLVLLATELGTAAAAPTLADLPVPVQDFVQAQPVAVGLAAHAVTMDYARLTVEEVLKQVFTPLQMEAPTSFETVDHVAHVNLRDAYLPYKRLIAEVILDKNTPRIRTVVNKTGNIETRFRTFPLEVLAGEDNLEVSVRESGSTFRFNYAEVYWNSRLSTEHGRLIQAVTTQWQRTHPREPLASCVVWDVFAGVGPFAVPLGAKGCVVHANDLNPRSHHYLTLNIQKNKVERHVTPYNQDGRAFVRAMASQKMPVHHILMNLPASALEFLDAFAEGGGEDGGLFDYLVERPFVHVYCFSKADDPTAEALARASATLGFPLVQGEGGVTVHRVRDVAPKKEMLCLSFPLPRYSQLIPGTTDKRKLEAEGEQEGTGAAKKRRAAEDA